jgi:Protein of Unknown function (DUF2784)
VNVYAVLADFLVVIHLAYISYVIFGQLAIMAGWPLGWRCIRNPWFRITHLIMILIVALEAVVQFKCPLTTWEEGLRVAAGQMDAAGNLEDLGFIARILRDTLMFDNSWDDFLNNSYYVVAGIVVATLFLVPPRFRKHEPATIPARSASEGCQ